MMRGLAVLPTLWLLLALAFHGEGRVLPNSMFDLQHDKSTEAVGVSTLKGHHHAIAPKPVLCTWVCGLNQHSYECHCVPIPAQQNQLLQTEDTTDSIVAAEHVAAPKAVLCTWVCGLNQHSYECHCLPIPAQDELLQAEDTIDSTVLAPVHVGDVDKVVAAQLPPVGAPVGAPQSDGASSIEGHHHAAAPKPVPCTWVCGSDQHSYECHCIPIPAVGV